MEPKKVKPEAVEIAEKYFEDAHLTGEGFLYFNRGNYVYPKSYGYAIVPKHKKVIARLNTLQELEEYFKKEATTEPKKSSKKKSKKPSKKSTKAKNVVADTNGFVIWKNPSGKKPTDYPDGKRKGQVQLAQELGIANFREMIDAGLGRYQASYILRIADPKEKCNSTRKARAGFQAKLKSMGVQFGTPTSSEVESASNVIADAVNGKTSQRNNSSKQS